MSNVFPECEAGASTKLTTGRGEANCTILVKVAKKFVLKIRGCQHMCERAVVVMASCCEGYWGPDCKRRKFLVDLPMRALDKCSFKLNNIKTFFVKIVRPFYYDFCSWTKVKTASSHRLSGSLWFRLILPQRNAVHIMLVPYINWQYL